MSKREGAAEEIPPRLSVSKAKALAYQARKAKELRHRAVKGIKMPRTPREGTRQE